MDLVATVSVPKAHTAASKTNGQVVEVWRGNGAVAQKVFAVVAPEVDGLSDGDRDGMKVEGLAWRPDGKMLAVLWDGGVVVVVDAYSGKVAHLLRVADMVGKGKGQQQTDEGLGGYAKISWQSHFANPAEVGRQLRTADVQSKMEAGGDDEGGVVLDDLLGLNADIGRLLNAKANLPRELARLEVDVALPKLSTLPATATGGDDDVFSTRHSVDMMFHATNVSGGETRGKSAVGSDVVDVLLTNVGGCEMHISIYDSFIVGKVNAATAVPRGLKAVRVVQDVSHPFLTTHYVVLEATKDGPMAAPKTDDDLSLHLVAMDLRFITQTGYNLPLLATKATQLQNLLRYLTQVSTLLSAELRTAFDLPTRFVENINEALAEENDGANFMTQAYHLIVTGTCKETFREWLVDQVGDRGLKRWEKAVGDCLDMMRRMTSECLLPAIERAQIVLSRLDGLSRFTDTASRLGLDDKCIRAVREVLEVLNLLCEDMLRDVCAEIREFAAFMRWLKWETEVQTLGEDSERAEEMREAYNGESEIRIVLDYIESAMKTSRLTRYILADPSSGTMETTEGVDLLEAYKKARASTKGAELLKLSDFLSMLTRRSQVVFDSIAETLRKNVLVSYIAELPATCNTSLMASRIVQSAVEGHFDLHILAEKKTDGTIMNIGFDIDTISRKQPSSKRVEFYPRLGGGRVRDIQALDDAKLLALLHNDGSDESVIACYSWSVGQDRINQVVYTFNGGVDPGSLAVAGRKGHDKVVAMDKEQLGLVVLEE